MEAHAALYTGDAFHRDWSAGTLDRVKSLGGAVAHHPGGRHYPGLPNQSCANFT